MEVFPDPTRWGRQMWLERKSAFLNTHFWLQPSCWFNSEIWLQISCQPNGIIWQMNHHWKAQEKRNPKILRFLLYPSYMYQFPCKKYIGSINQPETIINCAMFYTWKSMKWQIILKVKLLSKLWGLEMIFCIILKSSFLLAWIRNGLNCSKIVSTALYDSVPASNWGFTSILQL